MSHNQLKKKRKMELMNDDEKMSTVSKMNKRRSELRRKKLIKMNREDLAKHIKKDCKRKRETIFLLTTSKFIYC